VNLVLACPAQSPIETGAWPPRKSDPVDQLLDDLMCRFAQLWRCGQTRLSNMAIQPPNVVHPGIVQAIIKSTHASEPEKVQIAMDGADDLYREIRIKNTLKDENGHEVSLMPGATVRVIIKAGQPGTVAKG
jgi:hypothetical protein